MEENNKVQTENLSVKWEKIRIMYTTKLRLENYDINYLLIYFWT